jgi:segregation and condensation protein A
MSDDPDPMPPPAEPERAAPTAPVAVSDAAVVSDGGAGVYRVALSTFEGPLDLLLHLIQQHELDIRDIPIAFVSKKYVEYITLMQELNIDLASEYLVMAATLAHIKSKLLLPAPPADQDEEAGDDLDPRSELVRRLLEYQKYKLAGEQLGQNSVLGRDVFLRGTDAPGVDGPAPLAQVSVFKLFDAFQRLLTRVKQTTEHLVDVDRISISERILQLTDLLRGRGQVPFEQLFDEAATRSDLVVTFLALLEMTRLRMLQVAQEAPLAPICVVLTLTDEHDDLLGAAQQRSDLPDSLAEAERAPTEPDAPEPSDESEADAPEPSDETAPDEAEPSN